MWEDSSVPRFSQMGALLALVQSLVAGCCTNNGSNCTSDSDCCSHNCAAFNFGGLFGYGSANAAVCETSGGGSGGAAGLWVNANRAFDSNALSASGTPPATIQCGLTAATASAFDGQGNLWAAPGLSNINVWTPAELEAGCNPGPSIIMTYDQSDNLTFSAIAFDTLGNLWGSGATTTTPAALP